MIPYIGDFAEDETIYHYFNTFDSNDPSASVTITNLASTDLFVHKDGVDSTETTTGSTIDIDFDTQTGIHKVTIDTSSDAFYATGSDYMVRMEGTTVDGATINAALFTFSIENRFNDVNVVTVSGTAQTANDNGADINAILLDTAEIGTAGAGLTNLGGSANNWNVGKTGYSVVSTGLDAVVVDSTFLTAVEDQVWDAVLTGGSHNDATSAGRRLRSIGDFSVYENGAVWYDDVNGAAGTTDFENGTVNNPSNAEASVTTLLASLGLTTIHCAPGSTYVLEAAYLNKVFTGDNWTLDLNGQSIVGCSFHGATVSGVAAGTGTHQNYFNCTMGATSHIKGTHLTFCGMTGTQTVVEAGEFVTNHCHSEVAGNGSVTWDFGAALNSSNLSVRHHSGGWTIANMGAGTGTYSSSFEGNGQIVWAASCSATSNASIRGNWKITDNASGAVTETLDDNQTGIDAILVDTGTTIPALLGTPAADVSADIAAVKVDTAAILLDTADIQPNYATEAKQDTAQTDLDTISDGIIEGTAATSFAVGSCGSNLTGYTNDQLIGRIITFLAGPADGESSDITDYAETNGVISFTALTLAPENGNAFKIT